MKKFLALTVTLSVAIGLAQLFAGPERYSGKEMTQPALEQACNWTGFYFGANVGFGGGDVTWKDTDDGDNFILTHENPIGVITGGQIGYNRQFGSSLVLGLEGEFGWSDISDDRTGLSEGESDETDTFHIRNNWTGTIGLRIGFTSWNNRLLVYAKGGAAFERWEYDWTHQENTDSSSPGPPDTYGTNEWRAAPMLGFGLEYAITCHWSAKVEYKHLFLGDRDLSDTRIDDGAPEEETYTHELHQDSVVLGVNYKF
jgi:outer membrane immunogenic protein